MARTHAVKKTPKRKPKRKTRLARFATLVKAFAIHLVGKKKKPGDGLGGGGAGSDLGG